MKFDQAKCEELLLALLGIWQFDNGRIWKRIDFDAMDSLFSQGLITNPKGRQESVRLTEAGLQRARELAAKLLLAE
ncbi:hypothetical protein FNU76_16100 [Chitinimonas arctica]|uniref:DUF6429 domain-containing protein n=1 Tax=Chitinimonas arctica TaxID=2594795 RepID=A0A516SI85_9NEIS|nr:DUF6429 family protein [Chitinimonas arctica]QDQ27748.1 hypothetical protein FNU76_16100 [Chitinimonas arctica]